MKPTIKLLALMEATTVTGPAKHLINFCRRAREHEFAGEGLPRVEASIVTFRRAGRGARVDEAEEPNQFVAAARAAGIEVDVIEERFRFDTSVVRQLRRIVERRAPDIIETHMIKSHFLVKLSGLGQRLRWVAYHHGYTTTDLKMLVYNQFNRWSLPSANRVVTVCEPFARQLARSGVERAKISVRHNSIGPAAPVGTEEVQALRRRLGVNGGERLILSVGRLSREKGHVDLAAALGELRRLNTGLDFRLIIVGEGPERESIERAGAAAGVSERIIFAGHSSEVRAFYALADVLALPSHSEGSPLVLLEAMAAGVPVVATRVGGVPEIVSDGESALLVAPRDARGMAAALERVLTDEDLAHSLAANGSARVAADFSPESQVRSLVEIYSRLADAGAPSAAPLAT
ncbi:MAG: glycosyltransferase family 4 protein [Acidobacteria bacterium]|nr:glycosyltransferase family 4 protein [Acidobacteriota bacterium]